MTTPNLEDLHSAFNPIEMLDEWVAAESSDLHITAPNPPHWRMHGQLVPMPGFMPLSDADVDLFTRALVGEANYHKFLHENELDMAKTLHKGVVFVSTSIVRWI